MRAEFIGTIAEIWRYPVSSLGGEQLTSANLGDHGIAGDRSWCLTEAHSFKPAAPEKEPRWHPALFLQARLQLDVPEIGFPDGAWLPVDASAMRTRLAEYFGFDAVARPYGKASSEGTDPDEPIQPVANRYEPSPLHLVTTGTLSHLSSLLGTGEVSSRRFRPTVLVRTAPGAQFEEPAWIGKPLRLGSAVLEVSEETKRCGMTLAAQPGLAEQPEILRTILRQNRRNLGVYCTVTVSGTISVGDTLELA
jgi:uncharacterized protein YcbX